MKTVFSYFIPFRGFFAINLFGTLFVRTEFEYYFKKNATSGQKNYVRKVMNHEYTHTLQMKELLYIGFYILYFIEWIFKLIVSIFTGNNAYRSLSFEREAYANEDNDNYNKSRKHFAWLKYMFKNPD